MTNKKALIIIDVQLEMFNESNPVFQGDLLLEKINNLISRARGLEMPIIYIQHSERPGTPLEKGKPGWVIHPSVKPEANDTVIEKTTPDSFYNTRLKEELDLRGITELIMTGIQSEVCVDTTCRRAFSQGYKVTLVSDAHSTWNTNHLSAEQIINHHNNVLKWFAEVVESEKIFK
ncbi:cysteine hydrolase family protein [Paenibacillus sp. J2TS4]|uniref:cysteine hydrolase family protein n=1 Tax=Paenibacillus sp. J2TS4 TaxID=2807194 RepID=UPI001AFF7155|nr:cysteine hydrolase family protein [Paenibacillus sp. J2TS4]GIP31765.1 isochorismatase [Paenibacillus sp. J2TS4]